MSLRFAIFAMSCFRCLAASRSHSGFLWFSELADLSLFLVSFRCRRRRFACSPFPYVLAVVGVLDAVDERTIDLQRLDWKLLEIAQRRIAHAKIVQSQLNA